MTVWSAELLNGAGASMGQLPFEDVTARSSRSSGFSATLGGVDASPYDLLGVDVRIKYGSEVVCTVTPSGSPETRTAARTKLNVELSDRRSGLTNDRPLDTYSLAAGTAIVPALFAIVRATGDQYPMVIPDTGKVLSSDYSRSGVEWASIAGELLAAMGYGVLETDEYGAWTASPLDSWSTADPVLSLGSDIRFSPKLDGDRGLLSVPNRMIGTRKTTGSVPADRAVITDEDPSSPFSFPSRGKWITADPITDIDAADFATLQTVLRRRFDEARLTATFTAQLEPAPLRAGQVVDVSAVPGAPASVAVVESVSRPRRGFMTVELRGVR